MNDVLSVTMVDGLEEGLHVTCCCRLSEGLVDLLCDLLEKLGAGHVLHHQVDVLIVIVGLVVLDDIGVVEGLQDGNLILDTIEFIFIIELDFIEGLDYDLKVFVMYI